ncbi:MAG: 5-(carboxyamino)imidazole ribonucleotide synthase [Methylococcaceae bacterium]|nr:5-(carboxyamino)imidazole ribonucleotide synthase [Methylococcaceae bacterium]
MIVGILGAGQLARMIALAGYPLGLDFIFLDPSADACANKLGIHLLGDYNDPRLLAELAEQADVVTYEFENVPADVAAYLSAHTKVYPSPNALAVAQDRLIEKNYFQRLDIPTPDYVPVDSFAELEQAMTQIGWPAILKSRTQGYDGKGQSVLKSPDDLVAAWALLDSAPAIVEAFVPFDREVSIIAVRNISGSIVFYPLAENLHRGGILRVSESRDNDGMQAQAEVFVTRLMESLDYVGVLALELFEIEGQLIANEFAPRVHNSGHWTIEGAETSQFENHLRAILGLPLGATTAVGKTAMVNFIGGLPTCKDVLAIEHAHLHLYDKAPRKGRKVAHATVCADHVDSLVTRLDLLIKLAQQVDNS